MAAFEPLEADLEDQFLNRWWANYKFKL